MADEFFDAIRNSDANKVKELIAGAGSRFLNTPNKEGEFGVHVAAKARALNVLSVLLEAGANPNQASDEVGTYKGYTAAHYAARNDDVDAILMLHKHGADLNRTAGDGWTPLHSAAFGGKFQAIKTLISKKADINAKNAHNITPLLFAVNHGRVSHVREFLNNGADIDVVDSQGDTILHHCFHYQMSKMFEGEYEIPEIQFDVAVQLALHGVDVERTNAEGRRATYFLEEDIPALLPVLKILAHHHDQFLASKTDWNYMTFVKAARVEHFLGLGLEMRHAVDLYENLQNLEKQRLAEKKQREEERPAGGCPVMRGGRKKKGEAPPAPPAPGQDPSGGKCPFFQKKDGADGARAAAGAVEELPDGHPTVAAGADASKCPVAGGKASTPAVASAVAQHSEPGAKCPFSKGQPYTAADAARAPHYVPPPNAPAAASNHAAAVAEKPPANLWDLVYTNRQTVMLLVIAFFCGIWFEQLCANFRPLPKRF